MFKNYLTVALRNLMRHKIYTVINILSLSLGMAGCVIIAPQILYHLSFDRYHQNSNRIVRAYMHMAFPGQIPTDNCGTPGWLGRDLKQESPAVEDYARIFLSLEQVKLRMGAKELSMSEVCYSENSLFRLFSFEFAEGDPISALSEPGSLVLTQKTARRIFGDEAPLGRTVALNGSGEYKVTAILKDIPDNSHLQFSMLIPITDRWPVEMLESYRGMPDYYTYLLIAPEANYRDLEEKASLLLERMQIPGVTASSQERKAGIGLQPLEKVHLYSSHLEYDNLHYNKSSIEQILIYSAIAVLMLIMSCINFINLATARSTHRALEVGVRKVVGASRAQLIRQFLCESVLVSCAAVVLALILIECCKPVLDSYLFNGRGIHFLGGWHAILLMFLLTIGVGLLSGWYPALFLSLPQPQDILKGISRTTVKGQGLRKTLVVIQFAASIFLITSSLFIAKQLQWISGVDLGYNTEQVLTIRMSRTIQTRYQEFRTELLNHHGITGVCASGISPLGKGVAGTIMHFEGQVPGELWVTRYISVDPDFIPFFGLEVTEGRAFSPELITDTSGVYVIIETLQRRLGWNNAVGKKFWLDTKAGQGMGMVEYASGRVVGVVKDFHFNSLHHPIEPLAMTIRPSDYYFLALRIKPDMTKETLDFIEKTFHHFDPAAAFQYWFLNRDIEWEYRHEETALRIITGFTLLSILIACLGLIGLVSLAAERRTKEIGIRKTLGASFGDVLRLLSREFVILLGIATLFAWPVTFIIISRWLDGFAYHVSLDAYRFIVACCISFIVSLLVIGIQTTRVINADIVKSLRCE